MRGVPFMAAIALLANGCGAGWHQPATVAPGPMPARQQVQVWSGGGMRRWHGVRVAKDSISGVPFTESPECLTCRESLPRAMVDSLRVGDPVAGFWKSFGLAAGFILVATTIACGSAGGCPMGN
jgi:hypothetical protein